ncbi:lytic transglycosylase domain-containing protein [Capnocytophaga canimorsus]|uniref:lytic transglycosylase domain-containing protein n=1 Tax=Capnocytophaga canimorsus TaxID=28188 RepID=UPI001EDD2862|nr:lytic transglycosylase domain-containing protein [Capnocytophaga canimorsus]GJQ05550.1 murein transglycosylase [Capnocytophaga canimorsus]
MKNTTKNILSGLGVFFLGGLLINASSSYDSDNEKDNEVRPVKGYNVYAVDLPTEVDFAGEKAPLHIPDVRERLDRELLVNTYWQSNGLLFIKRANRYFPVIERILKENGVPDDFKYLALIESGLQDVVSPAGASGFWQFMKAAAKENGLEITDQVDERYHLEKATKAACDYLKKSKKSMGSWTLAAAAYNAGNTGVYNKLTAQKVTDYYDLWLNSETSRYVFRILAIKEIMKNPTQYGFNFESKDLYVEIPTYQVEVKESIDDLALFAQKYGVNFKELKLHNSWLRSNKLTVTAGKSYVIKIPKK